MSEGSTEPLAPVRGADSGRSGHPRSALIRMRMAARLTSPPRGLAWQRTAGFAYGTLVRGASSSPTQGAERNPALTKSVCQPTEAESLRVFRRGASVTLGVAFGPADAALQTESAAT